MTRAETFRDELAALFKARNSLIWICTREELRAERIILEAAGQHSHDGGATWGAH